MNSADAIREAKKGDLRPVYILVGEERLLRDEALTEIRSAALDGGIPAFNEDKFTAGEVDIDKVLSAVRTVPMMAKRRFVLVRNIDRWDTSSDDDGEKKGATESPLDRLCDYAKEAIDSTCLVLTASKLDGRRKLTLFAKKQGFVVQCDSLDTRALVDWISQRFKSKGNPADHDVCELLAEISGPDLATISDAVERLSLFVGAQNPITEAAVGECVARVRMADTWALVEAVGQRDLSKALRMFGDVYDPRDRGLPLLGALAWSIRQLAKFQAALAGGASPEDAAKRAGVFQPFRARELEKKAKGLTGKELERWILVLGETDLALKGSRRPPDAILEEMFTRLCRK